MFIARVIIFNGTCYIKSNNISSIIKQQVILLQIQYPTGNYSRKDIVCRNLLKPFNKNINEYKYLIQNEKNHILSQL